MQTEDLIAAQEFCLHHNVEYSFISSLNEFGLIEITTIKETRYIPLAELPRLEQFVRLHTDLDINLEGIQAINHLLQRVETMQREITSLKNHLRLYEAVNSSSV